MVIGFFHYIRVIADLALSGTENHITLSLCGVIFILQHNFIINKSSQCNNHLRHTSYTLLPPFIHQLFLVLFFLVLLCPVNKVDILKQVISMYR